MFRSSKLLCIGIIALCIIAVAIGFTIWSWSFTTSRLNAARSRSVFPSPSEGMLMLVQAEYVGIQEARIVDAGQEIFPLGGGPHVWFVTACVWAKSRADGSPVGSHTHDFDYNGYFFVDTHEGWLMKRFESHIQKGVLIWLT